MSDIKNINLFTSTDFKSCGI